MPDAAEGDVDVLREEIKDAESKLVDTVQEIRARVSFQALKNRALAEVREVAVEKPKRLARSAAVSTYSAARSAQKTAIERPLIPILIGIAVLTPFFVMRVLLRHR